MKQIGVIGSGEADEDEKKLAYKIGYHIGDKAVLVNGGLGGVMKASARGCKENGGVTIGILPSNNKRDANCFIDHVVVTGMGEARNIMVVKSSDVLISVGGGFGTLSEISFAKKTNKKIFGLGKGFSEELISNNYIEGADSPKNAVKKALDIE